MIFRSSTIGKIDSSVYNSLTHSADDLIKAYSKSKGHHTTVAPAILMAEYALGGTKKQGKEIKSWLKTQGFSEYASTKAVRKMSKKASRGRSKNSMKHKMKIKAIEIPDLPPTRYYRTMRTSNYTSAEKNERDIELRLWYITNNKRPDAEMEQELSEMWNETIRLVGSWASHNLSEALDSLRDIGDEINTPISIHDIDDFNTTEEWTGFVAFDSLQYDLYGEPK